VEDEWGEEEEEGLNVGICWPGGGGVQMMSVGYLACSSTQHFLRVKFNRIEEFYLRDYTHFFLQAKSIQLTSFKLEYIFLSTYCIMG
jgi:hypothetical protein